ncbi:Iron-dependent repressor IdeR [Rubripirellula lacrimiformis]|uniref:Transcriptional regulator MntR n=1 Tax=Rubripirellula lacrimiformis TaxID=1930273 RepID=A0A517NLA7_9BACT|nr:metal-dependent transcriptional regulator [Rubripirellula lacrimiformis]QDT07914.1 Iron-dependent repressor IdeR [Rubripirellula lacrimiformis]
MPSLTTENYIKAIYQLDGEWNLPAKQSSDGDASVRQAVATGAIANQLSVSPGSVTAMLKTLRDADLVEYAPYEGVRLTASGQRLALRVLRRHRLIELFLSQTLDMPWDEVHEEAEHMEHAVSDRLVDRIDAFLGYPGSDPHGDPIPRSDGSLDTGRGTTLTAWPAGQTFRLVRVLDQSSDFLRFLTASGLELSAVGKIIDHEPHAATTTVIIGDQTTVLSEHVADKLIVVNH